jgi:hypothetical protein
MFHRVAGIITNSRNLSIEIPTLTHHNFKVPAYDEQRD